MLVGETFSYNQIVCWCNFELEYIGFLSQHWTMVIKIDQNQHFKKDQDTFFKGFFLFFKWMPIKKFKS